MNRVALQAVFVVILFGMFMPEPLYSQKLIFGDSGLPLGTWLVKESDNTFTVSSTGKLDSMLFEMEYFLSTYYASSTQDFAVLLIIEGISKGHEINLVAPEGLLDYPIPGRRYVVYRPTADSSVIIHPPDSTLKELESIYMEGLTNQYTWPEIAWHLFRCRRMVVGDTATENTAAVETLLLADRPTAHLTSDVSIICDSLIVDESDGLARIRLWYSYDQRGKKKEVEGECLLTFWVEVSSSRIRNVVSSDLKEVKFVDINKAVQFKTRKTIDFLWCGESSPSSTHKSK